MDLTCGFTADGGCPIGTASSEKLQYKQKPDGGINPWWHEMYGLIALDSKANIKCKLAVRA